MKLIATDPDYVIAFLRLVAGIIMYPYGMQKLFGWFDGPGVKLTLLKMKEAKIPLFVAWLIIVGQSFGSIALIIGLLGKVAAAGLFVIMSGAMVTHLPDGWSMNWFGKKKGEGIEYFVLLLAILLVVIIKGSGACSIDYLIFSHYSTT